MKTFFTADTHFGCEKLVAHTRKMYSTVEEHDEALLDNINSTVDKHDQLVIIGDFCFKKPGRYRPKIMCRHIFFIMGNHDKEAQIRAVFGGNVWQYKMVNKIWCCHYPTVHWPQSHYGFFHAYGHIHNNNDYELAMDLGMPRRRSMDVGVDHALEILGQYRPFSEDEFYGFLEGQEGYGIIKPEERWNRNEK